MNFLQNPSEITIYLPGRKTSYTLLQLLAKRVF